MSQTASASPSASPSPTAGQGTAGSAPGAVPTVAGRLEEVKASIARSLSGTPGQLRILALLTVAVSLVFAIGAYSAFESADTALGRAEANTAQLVRIQAIHTNLIRADADATSAFLVGGLEPANERTSYLASMAAASTLITAAAQAQPADGPALGALNTSILTYGGLIEQARANNRQGLPVGAQYLQNASAGLRSDSLPILDVLVAANDSRVRAELDNVAGASTAVITSGLLALLVLIGSMVWLSRRTHRYVNVPLAAATVTIFVTLVIAVIALSSVSSNVGNVRDGSYAATLATAKARIAGFDAKSNESLTLIAHGSGQAFEQAWKSSSTVVTQQSQAAARLNSDAANMSTLWADYASTHVRIRALDDGGHWDQAVARATGNGPTSANAAFNAFDARSSAALTASSKAVSDSLERPRIWLALLAWLGLLVGIAAAVSAWWGVWLRLEEYR